MFENLRMALGAWFIGLGVTLTRPDAERIAQQQIVVEGYREDQPASMVAMLMRQLRGVQDGVHDVLMPKLMQERVWVKIE